MTSQQVESLVVGYDDQVSAGANAAAAALKRVGDEAVVTEERVRRASKSGEALGRQFGETERLTAKIAQVTRRFTQDLQDLEASELAVADKERLRANILAQQEQAIQKARAAHDRWVAGMRAAEAAANAQAAGMAAATASANTWAGALSKIYETAGTTSGAINQTARALQALNADFQAGRAGFAEWVAGAKAAETAARGLTEVQARINAATGVGASRGQSADYGDFWKRALAEQEQAATAAAGASQRFVNELLGVRYIPTASGEARAEYEAFWGSVIAEQDRAATAAASSSQNTVNALLGVRAFAPIAAEVEADYTALWGRLLHERDAATAKLNASYQQIVASVDPAVAAQQRYDKALADLRTSAAAAGVSATQLAADEARLTATLSPAAIEAKKQAEAIDALRTRVDPAGAALKRLAEDQKALDAAYAAGRLQGGKDEYDALTAAVARHRTIVEQSTASQKGMTNALGLTRGQMTALAPQINDVVSGLAMGQAPMQIFVQQGGQIIQALQAGGAEFKLFSGSMGLAFGAAAALSVSLIALVAANESYRSSINAVNDANRVMGDTTGFSRGQLEAMAGSLEKISTRSAREVETAFIRVGNVAGAQFQGATEVTRDFARVIGKDAPEAASTLADILKDPAKGAETLRDSYRALTSAQTEYVQRLAAQGETGRAQQAIIDAMKAKYRDFADEGVGYLGQALSAVGRGFSDLWDRIGKVGAEKTTRELLKSAEDELAVQTQYGRPDPVTRAKVDSLRNKVAFEDQVAAIKAANAAAEERMRTGLALSKQIQTEIGEQNQLEDQYAALGKSVAEYTAKMNELITDGGRSSAELGKVRAALAQVAEATERARNAKETYLTAAQAQAEQDRIALTYATQFGQQAERLQAYEQKRAEITGKRMTDQERQQALDSAVNQVITAQTRAVNSQVVSIEANTQSLTDMAAAYRVSASAGMAATEQEKTAAATLGMVTDLRVKLEAAMRAQAAAQRELAAAQFERGIQDQIKDTTALLAVEQKGGAAAYQTALAIRVATEARRQGRENDVAWIATTRDLIEQQDRLNAALDNARAKRQAALGAEFSTQFGQLAERERARRAAQIEAEKLHPDQRSDYVNTKVAEVINSQTKAMNDQVVQTNAATAATNLLTIAYGQNAVAVKDAELAQKISQATLGMAPDLAAKVAKGITEQEMAQRRLNAAQADYDLRNQIEAAERVARAEAQSGAAVGEANIQNRIRAQILKEGVPLESDRARAIEAGTRALEAQNAAAKVNNAIRGQNQDLTLARAEYELLGSTNAVRERAMGVLRATLEVQNDPAWQQAPEATREAWIRQAGAVAEYKSRIEDAKQAGADFASSLTKGLEDVVVAGGKVGDIGKEIVNTFKRGLFRETISKPLNEILTGTFTKLLAPKPLNDNMVPPVNDNDPGGWRKAFTTLSGSTSGGLGTQSNPMWVQLAGGATAFAMPQATAGQPMPVAVQNVSEFDALFAQAGAKYGLDPALLRAVAQVESSQNPWAVNSRSGAAGLMQIMPANFRAYLNGASPYDPAANIDAGARILKEHLTRAGGDLSKALSTYSGHVTTSGASYVAAVRSAQEAYAKADRSVVAFTGSTRGVTAAQEAALQAQLDAIPVQRSVAGAAEDLTAAQQASIDGTMAWLQANDNSTASIEVQTRAIDKLGENAISAAEAQMGAGQVLAQSAGGLANAFSSAGSSIISGAQWLISALASLLNSSGGAAGGGAANMNGAGGGSPYGQLAQWLGGKAVSYGAEQMGFGGGSLSTGFYNGAAEWLGLSGTQSAATSTMWNSWGAGGDAFMAAYGGGTSTAAMEAAPAMYEGAAGVAQGTGGGLTAGGSSLSGMASGILGAIGTAYSAYSLGGAVGTRANSKAAGAGTGAAVGAVGGFMVGGPWGALIGAVVGAILGAVGTKKLATPYGGAFIETDSTGEVFKRGSGAENGVNASDLEKQANAINTVMSGLAQVGGFKYDYMSFATEFSAGKNGKGALTHLGGWDGPVVSTSDSPAKVALDLLKALRDRSLLNGGDELSKRVLNKAIDTSDGSNIEDITKAIGLAKQINDSSTALSEFDASLKGVTDRAKKAQTDALKPMLDELELAGKFDIKPEYVSLVTTQLKGMLDNIAEPKTWTATETAVATLKGQLAAFRETAAKVNPEIATLATNIEAAALARIRTQALDEYGAAMNEATGRGYLNQLKGVTGNEDIVRRNLVAVGVDDPAKKAHALITEQIKGVLKGLSVDDLKIAAQSLTGDFKTLAEGMLATAKAASALERAQATNASNLSIMVRANTALGRTYRASLDQFDSTALKDALDTANAGGDVGLLVATQAVERQKAGLDAIEQMMQREIDARQQSVASIQQTVQAWDGVVDSLKDTRASLKIDQNLSTLSPLERMNEAQKQLADLYTKAANDNDVEAARKYQSLTSGALEATKGYYASSTAYATYFGTVDTQLGTLIDKFGDQADPQRELVKQAESQTKTLQDALTNLRAQRSAIERTPTSIDALTAAATTGLADLKTAMGALAERFPQSGGNNPVSNGLVQAIFRATPQTTAYTGRTSELDGHTIDTNRFIDLVRALGDTGPIGDGQLTARIFANADFRRRLNEALTTYESASAAGLIGKVGYELGGIVGAYATGGVVGNGLWGKDSVVAQYAGGGMIALAGGEGVLTAAATAAIGSGTVDYINRNLALPANDRWIGVAEYRRPAEAASPRTDTRGVEQRLDRACSLLERLLGVLAKSGDRTLDRLDALLDVAEEQVAHQSLKGAKAA